MMSKFNKEMYKKIRENKSGPFSSIGQKKLRFADKEKEKEKEKVGKGFVHSYLGTSGRLRGLDRSLG